MADLDILFLSETWLSCAEATLLSDVLFSYSVHDIEVLQTFAMDTPPGAGEGRRHGGTAMLCRRNGFLAFSQLQSADPRLLAVQVNAGDRPLLIIMGCYMPYFCGSFEQLEKYRDTCANLEILMSAYRTAAHFVLVGDFNCPLPRLPPSQRPASWARLRGFNAFSQEMQRLLDLYGLIVAEFYFEQSEAFTYQRGEHRTHIDHIAVPEAFIGSKLQSCKILSPCPDNLSPHLPMYCTLSLSVDHAASAPRTCDASSSHRVVLDWSSDERNAIYCKRLTDLLSMRIPLCSTANEIDQQLTDSIHEASADAGCSRRWKPPKSWWTPEVSAARDRTRFWHCLWTEAGQPRNTVLHDCFRAARRAYRRSRADAARAKADSGARLLSALRRDRNIRAFWRRVELARRGSAGPRSTLTAMDFRDHFALIHTDDDILSEEQEGVHRQVLELMRESRAYPGPGKRISAEEVARLLPQLNRDASPGPDGVSAEHLLHGSSPALLQALSSLLTACLAEMCVPDSFTKSTVVPLLKKNDLDPDCSDSYRPISLVCTVSKLLELILLEELSATFRPSELQFGFLCRRGTREATILVQETAQYYLSRKCALFVANLDARKCFDRIWHSGVLLRAHHYLSPRSWSLLAYWYTHLTALVRFGGRLSDAFDVRRGVRQGALLSPCLANLFLLPLIQQLDDSGLGPSLYGHHIPVVAYADDLLVMSNNVRSLQQLLDIVTTFSVSSRLDFVHTNHHLTKSHCFIFGLELLAQIPQWVLCGQPLSLRQETEHLGVQLQTQLQATGHVSTRIRRGRGAFFGLTPAGMFNPHLSAVDKAYLWRAVVSPVLLYGCAVCFLRSEDISRLDSWQATAIKSALRLPRTAHHTALLAALRIPNVQEILRRALFNAFRDAFRGEHRLRRVLLSDLAHNALNSTRLRCSGSLVSHMLSLCGTNFGTLLGVAGGHVSRELVCVPRPMNGVTDSLRWLLAQNSTDAWGMIKLLLLPQAASG